MSDFNTNPGIQNVGEISKSSTGDADLDFLNTDDTTSTTDDSSLEDKNEKSRKAPNTEDESDSESENSDQEEESEDDVQNEDEETDEDTEEETEEESDDSENDGDSEEEDLELKTNNLYNKIKKLSPELFKKIPELREVISRENKYSEVFDSPEQASSARSALGDYQGLEKTIIDGNAKPLLLGLQKTDKEAFLDFAHNFLPTISEIDKDAYADIVAPSIKKVLQSAFLRAKRAGNKDLAISAQNLHYDIFENTNMAEDLPVRKKAEENPESNKYKKELQERDDRDWSRFRGDTEEISNFKLNKIVEASLESYDMSSYARKNVLRDIIHEINGALYNDARYKASISSLLKQAKSAGLTTEWKNRVANAYLAKAKVVLPDIRKKVIKEAGVKVKGNVPESGTKKKLHRLTGGDKSNSTSKPMTTIPKGMSEKDFLAQD